ncbi:hypothetical protein Tco_1149877 [Tanacetum coccineum]
MFGSLFYVGELVVLEEVYGDAGSEGEGNGNVGKFAGSIILVSDVVDGFGRMLANGNSVSSNKTCLLVMVLYALRMVGGIGKLESVGEMK